MGKQCLQLFSDLLDLSLFLLASNEDRHKILIKFEFCHDLSEIANGVSNFFGHFNQIFFILAGNDHSYKLSTEFEFQQDRTAGF